MADQVNDLEISFVVSDHPHLGYRKEDRIDLENAHRMDILHGAFMGSAILRMPGADLSTVEADRGWRGLVEWCLCLDDVVRGLSRANSIVEMEIPDGNGTIQIFRKGVDLIFTCDWAPMCGRVDADMFVASAGRFICESVGWVSEKYPDAIRNSRSKDLWDRLFVYSLTP